MTPLVSDIEKALEAKRTIVAKKYRTSYGDDVAHAYAEGADSRTAIILELVAALGKIHDTPYANIEICPVIAEEVLESIKAKLGVK